VTTSGTGSCAMGTRVGHGGRGAQLQVARPAASLPPPVCRYDPQVEDTIKKYEKSLRELFKHYAAQDYDGLSMKGELLNLDEWNRMLADCELFDAVFSRREAAYCFVLSGMFVADEIKRREKLVMLPYESFLEALARVTCFKPLPTTLQMNEAKCATTMEYVEAQQQEGRLNEWCHANAPNWEVEMKEGRHLHEALDKLLQLVVERTTGDVTLPITAKILNKRKDGRENAR